MDSQNNDHATSHILSEEISSASPGDYYRNVGLVSLHMYADSIPDVAVDKDFTPPHTVTQNVSPVPVYDYLPRTHGVSDAVLGVTKDGYCWTIHEHSQIVSRGAIDVDLELAFEAVSNKPLAVYVF